MNVKEMLDKFGKSLCVGFGAGFERFLYPCWRISSFFYASRLGMDAQSFRARHGSGCPQSRSRCFEGIDFTILFVFSLPLV